MITTIKEFKYLNERVFYQSRNKRHHNAQWITKYEIYIKNNYGVHMENIEEIKL